MKGKKKSHAEAVGEKKFPTSHQQATFRHLLGSGASVHVVAWADRHFHNETPPSPLSPCFPPAFVTEQTVIQ